MFYKKVDTAKRFWEKVDSSAGEDACWPWKACVGKDGYGRFHSNDIIHSAHRFALAISTQRVIPSDMVVCHRCDNKLCCNPRHLFVGTQRDNIYDMLGKGRWVPPPLKRGEQNGNSKLSRGQVNNIRQMSQSGVEGKKLAEMFGVSATTISKIVRYKSWS